MHNTIGALVARMAGALALHAAAQTYPARPLHLVVGFPAGGPTDIVSRTLAPRMSETLSGQGVEPVGNTPGEFGAFVRSEIDKWSDLVKVARMKAD